jgi:hypothetical protein
MESLCWGAFLLIGPDVLIAFAKLTLWQVVAERKALLLIKMRRDVFGFKNNSLARPLSRCLSEISACKIHKIDGWVMTKQAGQNSAVHGYGRLSSVHS